MQEATILDEEVVREIQKIAGDWMQRIINKLHAYVPDFRTNPAVFLGGGSLLLKQQIEKSSDFKYIEFIEDIRANAVGWDLTSRFYLRQYRWYSKKKDRCREQRELQDENKKLKDELEIYYRQKIDRVGCISEEAINNLNHAYDEALLNNIDLIANRNTGDMSFGKDNICQVNSEIRGLIMTLYSYLK